MAFTLQTLKFAAMSSVGIINDAKKALIESSFKAEYPFTVQQPGMPTLLLVNPVEKKSILFMPDKIIFDYNESGLPTDGVEIQTDLNTIKERLILDDNFTAGTLQVWGVLDDPSGNSWESSKRFFSVQNVWDDVCAIGFRLFFKPGNNTYEVKFEPKIDNSNYIHIEGIFPFDSFAVDAVSTLIQDAYNFYIQKKDSFNTQYIGG